LLTPCFFTGKIDTLKHVKKDVMEMGKGTECGIGFDDFQDLQVDDQVQTYEIIKEKRYL
jgi:translation initiation factor IF-2